MLAEWKLKRMRGAKPNGQAILGPLLRWNINPDDIDNCILALERGEPVLPVCTRNYVDAAAGAGNGLGHAGAAVPVAGGAVKVQHHALDDLARRYRIARPM